MTVGGEAGSTDGVVHLRGGGVSLLVHAPAGGAAELLHWGPDLGEDLPAVQAWSRPVPHSAVDQPVPTTLLGGGRLTPALLGSREGHDWSPRWLVESVRGGPDSATVVITDPDAALSLSWEAAVDRHGVLTVAAELRNDGDAPYRLERLAVLLPLPAEAVELLDLTGRWGRERQPQRHLLGEGTWWRESRSGRPGHDATLLLVAGAPGFSNRSGTVRGAHLAWSGNHLCYAERRPDGKAVLGLGELLEPGEVTLDPGGSYRTPTVHAGHSAAGLDGLSAGLHAAVRSRAGHPRRPRPVVLNTWEAVYFDHDLDRLRRLADVAAGVGVERFVLDDGWFLHRRHDRAGLGDWYVDPAVWPAGLGPLVDHVRGLGMEFGLWVEPEMVNPDSDLFRAHPDWALRPTVDVHRLPVEWRHQQVLDLSRPDVWSYLLERLDALLTDQEIGFLKWDHNRDLLDAGHAGRPAARTQTLALYRLLDELRSRHPGVEIESCASGGARVDLGILARTDRVWASDSNDALERVSIQRWTQLLLPPELVGSHVGPTTAHTTGRTHRLSFRGAVALFGHFGLEWDIASLAPDELARVTALVATYREHRQLLHHGDVVHGDHPDPSAMVHGVVAADRGEALFAYLTLATGTTETPVPARLPGLAPDRRYRITVVDTGGEPFTKQHDPPGWQLLPDPVLSGRVLDVVGLPMPVLGPEEALVLHLQAV